MRLLALTVATASVLAFAVPAGRVLAQGNDNDAVGRPLQLDGGAPLGSDSRGQSFGGRSERTEQPASVAPEKSETRIGKTDETTSRPRAQMHTGLRYPLRHRLALHKRSHHLFAFHAPRHHRFAFHGPRHRLFAFHAPRHRFVIHRHGRRFVAFSAPASV
jgi:hypothetical protein